MALTDKLTDIADAIRAKTGESDLLTLDEMPDAIAGITGGGVELPNDLFAANANNIRGTGLFAHNRWKYIVENYPDKIILPTFNNLDYAFENSNYTFPKKLYINMGSLNYIFSNFGTSSGTVLTAPYVEGLVGQMQSCFYNARLNLPQDWFSHLTAAGYTQNYVNTTFSDMFNGAIIRGTVNMNINMPADRIIYSGSNVYLLLPFTQSGSSNSCNFIDELINIPVGLDKTTPSRSYSINFPGVLCKKLKFQTNNGTPYSANWKGITLDFTHNMGWYGQYDAITRLSNVLGLDATTKQITDATSYELLKNDPDRWTDLSNYALYNKLAAIETINTLPDVSASGTATVKFVGTAGSLTDGGAINTMTAAEIAVATAKGWTITFV